MSRNWQYFERKRIFAEAFHDSGCGIGGNTQSIGEIVAKTSSISLGINCAEVLVDPKLRYRHPRLIHQ